MDNAPLFGGVMILLLTALASYNKESSKAKSSDGCNDESMMSMEDSEVFLVLKKNSISSARSSKLLLSYSKEIYFMIASYMDTDDILSFSRTCSLLSEEFSCDLIWEQLWRLRYGQMWQDFAYLRELRGIHWNPYANWGDPLSGWFTFYLEFEYCWANWLLAGCNNRDKSYMVLYNQIYDVTKFIPNHPGSAETLLEHCGGDATQSFIDIGHSNTAKQMSSTYVVGAPEYNVGSHEDLSLIISLVMNEQNKNNGGSGGGSSLNMIQAIRNTMESMSAIASSAMGSGVSADDAQSSDGASLSSSMSAAALERYNKMREVYSSLSTEQIMGMVRQTEVSINTQEMYSRMLSISTAMSSTASATMHTVANTAKKNMTRLSTSAKQTMSDVAETAKQTMSDMFNPDNSDFDGDDGLSNMEIFDAIDSSLEFFEEASKRLRSGGGGNGNKNRRAGSLGSSVSGSGSISGSNSNSRRGSYDGKGSIDDSIRHTNTGASSSPSASSPVSSTSLPSASRTRPRARISSSNAHTNVIKNQSYGGRRYHAGTWNQNSEGVANMRHNVIYCLEIEKLAILNYLNNNRKTRLVARSQSKVTTLQGHMSCNPNTNPPPEQGSDGNVQDHEEGDGEIGGVGHTGLGLGLGNEHDIQEHGHQHVHHGNNVLSLIGLGGQHCGQPKLFYDPLAQEWTVWWSCCAVGEAIPYHIIKSEIGKLPIINSSSKRLSAYMTTAYSEYIGNRVLRRTARTVHTGSSDEDAESEYLTSSIIDMNSGINSLGIGDSNSSSSAP